LVAADAALSILPSVGRKKFNDHPFAYHQELELEISTLTNLGVGLGRVQLTDPARLGTCDLDPASANTADAALHGFSGGGWVVMVPFSLPGERVRVRVFRNHKNYSEADLVGVLTPSPRRVPSPRCPLFGRCGGCQYQHLAYPEQLEWKRRQVTELLSHMAGIEFAVAPVVGSPRQYGYRSKITPHFAAPSRRAEAEIPNAKFQIPNQTQAPSIRDQGSSQKNQIPETGRPTPETESSGTPSTPDPRPPADCPIGFLKQGSRFEIIDVPRCEIATDAINVRLATLRAEVPARILAGEFQRGATLLLRDAGGTVTTDYAAVITEEVAMAGLSEACPPGSARSADSTSSPQASSGEAPPAAIEGSPKPANLAAVRTPAPLRLRFLARDFFQNNPFILPVFAAYVRDQAAASNARFLIDAYCGSGLFALAAAPCFERVAGIEVSETSVGFARENALANGITNASFLAGDAAAIFAGVDFPAADTAVVIDPPRKGCDEPFLRQLFSFGPRVVVYVSCDPATQMRDLGRFLSAGYVLTAVQPFDLFPQTRHLECVITLKKSG
jgi:23S rRNA (uracil1939-C5)-methyltransferase/tRNA (uracil-5-)-methyltransferase